MRKLVTAAFVSVDNVMQAPGAPEEDRTGGFDSAPKGSFVHQDPSPAELERRRRLA